MARDQTMSPLSLVMSRPEEYMFRVQAKVDTFNMRAQMRFLSCHPPSPPPPPQSSLQDDEQRLHEVLVSSAIHVNYMHP